MERGDDDFRELCGKWDSKYHKGTEFHSAYRPDMVSEELHKVIEKLPGYVEGSLVMHEQKHKLAFNVVRGVEVPEEEAEGIMEKKEEEEEEEEEMKIETKFNVKLLEVEPEIKLAVEFSREDGS